MTHNLSSARSTSCGKKLAIVYLLSEIYVWFLHLHNHVNIHDNGVTSNAHHHVNVNVHHIIVSASSIPRSNNAYSRSYSNYISSSDGDDGTGGTGSHNHDHDHHNNNDDDHNHQQDDDDDDDDDGSHNNNHSNQPPNNYNHKKKYNTHTHTHTKYNHNSHNPPWNKSPNIDPDGFITSSYHRTPGEWETEANIGGRHTELQNKVLIRQVPGDGNCLFHSISVALALVVNATHIDMVGNGNHPTNPNHHRNSKKRPSSKRKRNYKHIHPNTDTTRTLCQSKNQPIHDLKHLYAHSRYLREKAVDFLSHNPRRLLFLQGNEYLRARDLVNAAAAQYNLTGEEYCDLMRRESYWGGGPEIVALCNYLKRPIHVYELCSGDDVHEGEQEEEERGMEGMNSNGSVSVPCEKGESDYLTAGKVENKEEEKMSFKNLSVDNTENSRVDDKRHDMKVELDSVTTASSNSGSSTSISTLATSSTSIISSNNNMNHRPNKRLRNSGLKQLPTNTQFRLRRMACFGSPKFDRKEPIHILSADSRFPDVKPGKQLSSGNHFMTLFPEELIHAVHQENKRIKRKRKSAGVRGGGSVGVRVGESVGCMATETKTSLYEHDLDLEDVAMERPRRRRRRKGKKFLKKRGQTKHPNEHPDTYANGGIGRIFDSIYRSITRWMSSL